MAFWCMIAAFAISSSEDLNAPQIGPFEGAMIIPYAEGKSCVESMVVAYGKVIATKKAASRTYLNFHENFEVELSIAIDAKFYSRFETDPHELFLNHRVACAGVISGESGAPQLRVTSPEQLAIIPPGKDAVAWIKKRFRGVHERSTLKAMQRTPDLDHVRFGSYNVLNLFDEKDDPYRDDEVMSTKVRQDLEKVADRIRKMNADVVCLQEVESRFYLERFVKAMLPEMGYEHVVLLEANNARGIDCAVLSRFPVGPVTSYQHVTFQGPDGKTYRFQRDLLRVEIEVTPSNRLDVFCVHLKSKYGGAELSEPIRQAEARKIRDILDEILEQDPQAEFFIAGDFNDEWESESLKILRGGGDKALWCGFEDVKESDRVTYNKEPYLSMIDFLLVSPALRKRYIEDSYRVIQGTVETSGSDHNPISAGFQFGRASGK